MRSGALPTPEREGRPSAALLPQALGRSDGAALLATTIPRSGEKLTSDYPQLHLTLAQCVTLARTSREAGGGDGGDVVVRSGGPQVWLRVGPCLDSRGSVVDRVRHSV